MGIKAVASFLFEDAAWSELLYFEGSDFKLVQPGMVDILAKRRPLLGSGVRITKFRLTDTETKGIGQLFQVNLNGLGGAADGPWNAVQMTFNSEAGARRTFKLAGLPDAAQTSGHFARSALLVGARTAESLLRSYADAIVRNKGCIAYQNRTQTPVPVMAVDANGNVVTAGPFVVAVGDSVQFYRTRYDGGRESVAKRWRVDSFTDATHFKVLHWPTGRTVSKGQIFLIDPLLSLFTSYTIGDTTARKTGRPSGRQRGRRSIAR